MADVVPQPQERAGSRDEDEFPQQHDEAETAARPGGLEEAPLLRHCRCGKPLLRAHRDECAQCSRKAQEAAQKPVQGAFLVSVTGGGQTVPQSRRERVQWPVEDPTTPLRVCACGREHRLPDSETCPDCVYAVEEQRLARKVAGR